MLSESSELPRLVWPDAHPLPFDPGVNLLCLVFSAVIGIVFGYVPARRAAMLDPIVALRYELRRQARAPRGARFSITP